MFAVLKVKTAPLLHHCAVVWPEMSSCLPDTPEYCLMWDSHIDV